MIKKIYTKLIFTAIFILTSTLYADAYLGSSVYKEVQNSADAGIIICSRWDLYIVGLDSLKLKADSVLAKPGIRRIFIKQENNSSYSTMQNFDILVKPGHIYEIGYDAKYAIIGAGKILFQLKDVTQKYRVENNRVNYVVFRKNHQNKLIEKVMKTKSKKLPYYLADELTVIPADISLGIAVLQDDAEPDFKEYSKAVLIENQELKIVKYNDAIKLKRHWLYFYDEAIIYLKRKEYKLALENINETINLNPEYSMGYYHRAIIYSLMEKGELAIKDLETANEMGNIAAKDALEKIKSDNIKTLFRKPYNALEDKGTGYIYGKYGLDNYLNKDLATKDEMFLGLGFTFGRIALETEMGVLNATLNDDILIQDFEEKITIVEAGFNLKYVQPLWRKWILSLGVGGNTFISTDTLNSKNSTKSFKLFVEGDYFILEKLSLGGCFGYRSANMKMIGNNNAISDFDFSSLYGQIVIRTYF